MPTAGRPGVGADAGRTDAQRPRRTQAERRAASERRLLDAASRLIAERGTTAVGFGEIAKAAGVSHGLPSYLFGTKVGLLCALVDDFADRIQRNVLLPLLGEARGAEALVQAMRLTLGSLAHPWPQARTLNILLGEALGVEPELRASVNRYHAAQREMIARWIREGIEDGDIRPDADPVAQSMIWMAVIRGISYQAIADPAALPVEAVVAEAFVTLQRTLGLPDGVADAAGN